MKMVTTKAIAKVAAVAAGLAMATSMLTLAPTAYAASLTDAQVQSILSLLTSFGANSATIANVQAALTGQPTTGGTTGSTVSSGSCSFTKDLKVGSSGAEVTCLQNALKAGGYMSANATGYFGALTKAGVIAWQKAKGVSPAVGYFGAKSRAAFSGGTTGGSTSGTTGGTTTTPVTGNGLKVSIASDSPSGVALVQGQSAAELAKFTFANPTSADIKVTNLGFNRIGVSNDSTMTNVYLYNGAIRITDSAGVSNTAFNFNDSTGLFTVPAGGTYTLSVRSDIAGSTSGEQIGVKLVSVTSSGTLDSSVSFPVTGGLQTISSASMATVQFNTTTLPSATTVDPQADYTVWQNTVTVGTRAVLMKSFQLKNIGSILSGDVINFRLYVDGVKVGETVAKLDANNVVSWDLSAKPVRLETGGRVVKVLADVVGGASRTFQMSLRQAADGQFIDTDLNQPVLVTGNSTSATATFAAHSATSETINSVSNSAPSVTRAADSPTASVANGSSNVKWATFKIVANGEDVKVTDLNITADTSSSGSGLDNGKVFLNGVQVGSTKDLAEFGGTTTNFTFGSSFIVKVGTTAIVDIYADAKTSASANLTANETVQIYLATGSSNAQGQVSLSSINVPTANVTGNSITVSASSLSATKASYYGNQTVIAGAQNIKLGAFTLSTGSTEGVNVNTIEVAFAAAVSSTISDLVLKDHDTGAQFGSSKATVGTTNSFTGSVNIPASGTKTYDIYANVKTGVNAGVIGSSNGVTISTNTTSTGLVTGSSVSVGTAATLQNITVGSATLTVTQNPGGTPSDANIVAGSSMVKVGSFRFTTQYSPYTVDQVAVKVTANSATSVSAVIVEYKDASGVTKTNTQALTLSSGSQTHATATFTGLSFYVPSDSNRDLTVYVNTPTVASGATSGRSIVVTLDANEGFNSTDSSGATDTSLASSDLNSNDTSGRGTMYVRKSIPTLTAGTAPNTTLVQGSNEVLGRFNVTADAAGDIDWGQVGFTINKNAAVTIGATTTVALWDVTSGASSIAGTFGTTTTAYASGGDAMGTQTSSILKFQPTTVQTVAAGETRKYELRGTVADASGAGVLAYTSVSIANPQTSASSTMAATFAQAAGNAGQGAGSFADSNAASFVWSDWSDTTDHATNATQAATTDWIGDYLVKNLPLAIGSRSAAH